MGLGALFGLAVIAARQMTDLAGAFFLSNGTIIRPIFRLGEKITTMGVVAFAIALWSLLPKPAPPNAAQFNLSHAFEREVLSYVHDDIQPIGRYVPDLIDSLRANAHPLAGFWTKREQLSQHVHSLRDEHAARWIETKAKNGIQEIQNSISSLLDKSEKCQKMWEGLQNLNLALAHEPELFRVEAMCIGPFSPRP